MVWEEDKREGLCGRKMNERGWLHCVFSSIYELGHDRTCSFVVDAEKDLAREEDQELKGTTI